MLIVKTIIIVILILLQTHIYTDTCIYIHIISSYEQLTYNH